MDLTGRLRRWTLARPRVLLVDAPGSRTLRWQVEGLLDERGWPLALSPADTDLLVVLGRPGPQLAEAIDVLWSQTPSPRHRHQIHADDDVATEFDRAHAALVDDHQDHDEPRATPAELLARRTPGPADHGGHAAAGHDMGDDMGHDIADMGHEMAAMGHDTSDHMSHEMGHGGHDMGDVAGLPMAGTAADRDGLELDSLQVSLGPVLPGWPTGLVVRGALQGDVLTDITVGWVDGPDAPAMSAPSGTSSSQTSGTDRDAGAAPDVVALDNLSRFLLVAGWPAASDAARSARTDLLSPDVHRVAGGRRDAARLARRVRGSRTLRWSVRGLGGPSPQDVLSQVYRWCDVAAGTPGAHAPDRDSTAAGVDVAGLLEGAELAAVRLVVAGLDADRLGAAPETPVRHGAGHD